MKKILVPTDFSTCAEAAELYAFELARALKAEIHFLHLVHTPVEWVKLPVDKESLYPETKALIADARLHLNQRCKEAAKMGLEAKQQLAYNRGHEELVNYVEIHHIDLVVMGSHGAEGLKEVLGSNAQMMVRYAPVPTLVVKKSDITPSMKKLVFASTFDADFVPAYQKVRSFAQALKAELYLLRINTPYDFCETSESELKFADFMKIAGEKGLPFYSYDALNEERGITQFCEKHNIDMVALATRTRGNWPRLVSPSLTESMVNHATMPILSVK